MKLIMVEMNEKQAPCCGADNEWKGGRRRWM